MRSRTTLVVSQDLDIGVRVEQHAEVKRRLPALSEFHPASDEPSVWVPRHEGLLEINFIGMDAAQDPAEAYILDDGQLLVFGALSLVSPGPELELAGTTLRLPRPSGLVLEELVTDRTGEKGDLLEARPGMPDPGPERGEVAALLRRLAAMEHLDP